jgi:hypothetical protein
MLTKPNYPKQKKLPSVNDLWNIISINEGFVLSHTPFMATAICYFPALYLKERGLLAEQQMRFIRTFFSLPVDSLVSAYLLKYPRDSKVSPVTKSQHETLNFLEEKRVAGLNNFETFEYGPYIAISIPIPHKSRFKLKTLISGRRIDLTNLELIRGFKSANDQLENIVGQLRATYSGQCARLSSQGVAQFLGLVLNHTTQNNTSDISSIICSDFFSNNKIGVTYYGGFFHACLSIRHDGFPGTAEADLWEILFDESLKRVPFTVKMTIGFPDSIQAKKGANAIVSRINTYNSFVGNLVKDLMVQKEKLDQALIELEQESGRLLDMSLVVETWAPSIEGLEMQVKTLNNVIRSKEIALKRDTYNHKASFHSILPFASHINSISTRIPSMHIEPFLPLLFPATYPNSKPPEVPTYIHSAHDVLMAFDIMDERDPSWNGMIAGTSGTGKSFLANFLIANHLKSGGKLFIIDKGGPGAGSYRNLIMNIPTGRYIELKFIGQMDFTVNFFDGPLFVKEAKDGSIVPDIQGEVDGGKENFLTRVITLMVKDLGDRISKADESRLSKLFRDAYLRHNNNIHSTLNLDIFCSEFLSTEFPELVQAIHKFIGDGIYSKFFKSTTKMDTVDCFCFDLEGIDAHEDLAPILTLVITSFAYSMCQNSKHVRKMIVVDEAWSAFRGPLSSVIENIWRTIRKHNGFIYCVTQGYEDIQKSEVADALMNNTTHYFMCGASHRREALEKLSASGESTNRISEYDFQRIGRLAFKKGEYAEYYLLTPNYKGAIRLRPSSYDYWFSTTNAKDKTKIDAVKNQLGVSYVTREVLERVVESN